MKEIDAYKFQQEIQTFKKTIAPYARQMEYLVDTKDKIRKDLLAHSQETGHSIERCLLVALCGELTAHSSKQQQSEFATRLVLLDLLTEQI